MYKVYKNIFYQTCINIFRLQATYDLKETGYLSQIQLYAEYMTFAKKYALPQLLPAHSFMNCVKYVLKI